MATKPQPNVSFRSETVTEDLPLPAVHYPTFYGTFHSFSALNSGERFLCECSKTAVLHSLQLSGYSDGKVIQPNWWDVSEHFAGHFYKKVGKSPKRVEEVFSFRPGLCHRCNHKVPALLWCHPMYGNKFVQHFGWYIRQTALQLGYFRLNYLTGICPPDIAEKITLINKVRNGQEEEEAEDREVQFDEFMEPIDDPDGIERYTEEERKLADKYEKELEKLPEKLTREAFSNWYQAG